MHDGETGKTRSQRIQLDYHRQPDTFYRWRIRLATVALIIVAVYLTVSLWSASMSSRSRLLADFWKDQVSTGPLAHAHAAFEHDCDQCHGDKFGIPLAADAWRPFSDAAATAEQSCSQCHPVSHHFIDQLLPEHEFQQRHCVLCHRDHLGRDHDMTAVANSACIACHADLDAIVKAGQRTLTRTSIQEFTADSHGDFSSLKKARGAVKFNHYLHMQPGLAVAGDGANASRAGLTASRLAERYRERYATSASDPPLVQLSCEDCHELGHAGRGEASGAALQTADGHLARYFGPIEFERHCEACHSLNYAGQSGDRLPLPHAAPRAEFTSLLRAKIDVARTEGAIVLPTDATPKVPVPGDSPAPDRGNADELLVKLMADVQSRCLQCHDASHITDEYVMQAAKGKTPSLIPQHWLLRGSFDHGAHGGMDCRFCHAKAYENPSAGDHEVVMIDGIEKCTPCHRPSDEPTPDILQHGPLAGYLRPFATHKQAKAKRFLAQQPTWASDQCTLCHRYHWTRQNTATATVEGAVP